MVIPRLEVFTIVEGMSALPLKADIADLYLVAMSPGAKSPCHYKHQDCLLPWVGMVRINRATCSGSSIWTKCRALTAQCKKLFCDYLIVATNRPYGDAFALEARQVGPYTDR